jgi:hypothetical protein
LPGPGRERLLALSVIAGRNYLTSEIAAAVQCARRLTDSQC